MVLSYGKILKVDLSTGKIIEQQLDEETVRKYVGGSGLNAKILFDHVRKVGKINSLSEENLLIFSIGPLTGTGFLFTTRYYVAGISPLTGIYGQASSGGKFAAELRRTGYVSIIFEGISEKPVYLKIDREGATLEDASSVWGLNAYTTQGKLLEKLSNYSIACIGRAGEKLVKYAAITNDGGRVAGRTGLGAVMGYKKLKAITVKGWQKPSIANKEELLEAIKEAFKAMQSAPAFKILQDYGTSGLMETLHKFGDVPIKNFTMGYWDDEKIKAIAGPTMAKLYLKKRYHCEACPVGCGRIVELDGKLVDGPEYETLASLGSNLLNYDLRSIIIANFLCNDYGIDTISTGVTIAFAVEATEKGYLEKSIFDVGWGESKKIVELIRKIGEREEVGDLLAEGVKVLSERLGEKTKSFAVHVKGLEAPMHDPRAFASWALGYTTSNRGACHTYSPVYYIERGLTFPEIGLPEPLDRFDTGSKPRAVKLIQDMTEFLDSMVMCRFCLYNGVRLPLILRAFNAVLGTDWSVEEAMRIGERIFNTKRYINNVQGVTHEDDVLPKRFLEPLNPPGGSQGFTPKDYKEMLGEYYRLRGWNSDGTVPLHLIT